MVLDCGPAEVLIELYALPLALSRLRRPAGCNCMLYPPALAVLLHHLYYLHGTIRRQIDVFQIIITIEFHPQDQ